MNLKITNILANELSRDEMENVVGGGDANTNCLASCATWCNFACESDCWYDWSVGFNSTNGNSAKTAIGTSGFGGTPAPPPTSL